MIFAHFSPSWFRGIKNEQYKSFCVEMNKLWFQLGRKVSQHGQCVFKKSIQFYIILYYVYTYIFILKNTTAIHFLSL